MDRFTQELAEICTWSKAGKTDVTKDMLVFEEIKQSVQRAADRRFAKPRSGSIVTAVHQ